MPVIVTGTGRCGSSAVARVLHEQLGVHMGERFDRIRPPNPEGTYEDLDFRDLHVALGRGELERAEFEDRARALIAARNAEHGERWGFKDPRASTLLDFYLEAMPDAFVVIPIRNPDAVVDSVHRHYGTPIDTAREVTDRRWRAIMSALAVRWAGAPLSWPEDGVVARGRSAMIDMRVCRSDEWIALTLSSALLAAAGVALQNARVLPEGAARG